MSCDASRRDVARDNKRAGFKRREFASVPVGNVLGKQSARRLSWRKFTHVPYETFDRGRRTSDEVDRLVFVSGWRSTSRALDAPGREPAESEGNTTKGVLPPGWWKSRTSTRRYYRHREYTFENLGCILSRGGRRAPSSSRKLPPPPPCNDQLPRYQQPPVTYFAITTIDAAEPNEQIHRNSIGPPPWETRSKTRNRRMQEGFQPLNNLSSVKYEKIVANREMEHSKNETRRWQRQEEKKVNGDCLLSV